jgi:DsbC/DsbD-like thiol-disulfide interchange protein
MRTRKPTSGISTILLLGTVLALSATSAQAAATPIPHGTIELIAENPWIAAGHTVNVGLRFQLEKGWHIYWINPGDSGEPPRVKWQLPAGLAAGAIDWPVPKRLGRSTVVDYGYQDAITLIVPVHVDATIASQTTAQLAAQVSVLVCREMCIPGKAQLSLSLPVKSQQPSTDARTESLFAAARKSLPRPMPASWRFRIIETNDSFVLTANLGRQITGATFYPLVESQIDNAGQQRLEPLPTGFRLTLRKSDQLLKPIERLNGVLVLSAGQAYSMDVPVRNATRSATSSKEG